MALQRTFAMLKPGILQRRIVGDIIGRFESKGMKLIGLKIMSISPDLAARHYAEHKEKSFYGELIEYITSGPVVAMALEGEEVISQVRRLAGPTSVTESLPGTIRGDYCVTTTSNVIHSSDSPDSAARELKLFFQDSEIVQWEDGNASWY